jgi:uncharacterized protein (DUF1778 family)
MAANNKYSTSKEKKIEVRVSEELKEEFKEVAELEQTDVSKLIVTHMKPILKEIKRRHQSEKVSK